MKWLIVEGTHINTDRVDTFFWRDGQLWVCFSGAQEPTTWEDPDRKLYARMCRGLGVRQWEEDADGES